VNISGVNKLAATVRFCTDTKSDGVNYDDPCPYANAFWNGTQMFYGDGFAAADDVVGHEMTHGVIDRYSQLFYWGQSGAINESLADTMGELIDHRNGTGTGTDDDSAWDLGEDLAGGPLRNMKDPTLHGQPDTMTSGLYTADANYSDSAGVHTNSGVGNKTAYLISQGTGSAGFNGRTFAGIDGGDTKLTKTATLYLDVVESLPSGADYATLAAQLDQSCQDLLARPGSVFTAADCTAVHQATLATQLASPPANVPLTTPAGTTCASGTKRVLFDSEAGNPAAAFTPTQGAPAGWRRDSGTFADPTWFVDDTSGNTANSLSLDAGVALPAGQLSFLSFRGWWVLDFEPSLTTPTYYDGGTVELAVDGGASSPLMTGWTNGPGSTLIADLANPWRGLAAFSGDSRGWVQSRVDLSPYAGKVVRPAFTLRSYDPYSLYGWALDDITIYTCDGSTIVPPATPAVPSAPQAVTARGSLNGMTVSWVAPALNPAAVTAYQVSVGGVAVGTVPAAITSLAVGGLPGSASTFPVTVQAFGPAGSAAAGTSINVPRGYPSIRARRVGARLRLKGALGAGGAAVAGVAVQVQRRTASGWRTVRTVGTRSDGSYVTSVRRPRRAYYRAVFQGSPGAVGTASARHRW
jgi:hypothetical protein